MAGRRVARHPLERVAGSTLGAVTELGGDGADRALTSAEGTCDMRGGRRGLGRTAEAINGKSALPAEAGDGSRRRR
ncbi:hypothetical protein GCM10027176_07810 [Actinoallomurus bryophytorum]